MLFMSEPNDSKVHETTLSAAILCGDDDGVRAMAWVQLLRHRFQQIWLSSNGHDWRDVGIDASAAAGLPAVHALFFHVGDLHLESKLDKVKATQVFLFNTPGTPKKTNEYLPILRPAGKVIDLTTTDVDEIADYVVRPQIRKDVPKCCTLRSADHLLPSLAILCQGYLAAHACASQWGSPAENVPAGTAYRRALSAMGWDSFSQQANAHSRLREFVGGDSGEESAKRLRERARGVEYWRAVTLRLGDIVSGKADWEGGAEGLEDVMKLAGVITAGNFPLSDVEMVANAYLALQGRLAASR
jgi:hypothetical protein